ncbi:hypothetical protein [Lentibacter sp.]|uniref:hypothetical protein n=1 Tax=Lentibacter sp. TaxID=2024994 RepID=UPI003F69A974
MRALGVVKYHPAFDDPPRSKAAVVFFEIDGCLPQEGRYARALSLSRLACDLENIISPMLAVVLLSSSQRRLASASGPYAECGYISSRLLGVLPLNFFAAAAGVIVRVNTVVLVRSDLGF